MSSRWRWLGLRLAHRSPDIEPFILDIPSSLTECVPVNITWSGGTPPYALQANFENTEFPEHEPETIATGINTTHFLWNADVASGSFVSFELIDALNNRPEFAGEATFVRRLSSGVARCVDPPLIQPRVLHVVSSSRMSPTPQSTSFTTTLVTVRVATATIYTVVKLPTYTSYPSPAPSSTFYRLPAAPQRDGPLFSGSSIAVTVLGVLFFLLLGTFPWWRSCTTIRKRGDRKDTEKQDAADGGDGPGDEPVEPWGEPESRDGRSKENSDPLGSPGSNPFEDLDNVVSMAQIVALSPVSDSGEQTPSRPPLISAPPSTTVARADDNVVLVGPLKPKVKAALMSRTPSTTSAQSNSGSERTSMLAARLSTSTASTLPPSYRTRRSAGSIYISASMPNYPPFPPPAYNNAGLTRVPGRTLPAPVPPAVSDGGEPESAASVSGEPEHESPLADGPGMGRASTRTRDGLGLGLGERVEGSGTDFGELVVGSAF